MSRKDMLLDSDSEEETTKDKGKGKERVGEKRKAPQEEQP